VLLKEIKLWELSPLTAWGANQHTPLIGMKGKQNAIDRAGRLIKALETGTFTDASFLFLQDELLYLEKALKDISTEPIKITLPETFMGKFNI
jgi:hypothetical protein